VAASGASGLTHLLGSGISIKFLQWAFEVSSRH